jgi:hypothetical protein
MRTPPPDEAIQEPFSPTQQKEDEVSCFFSNDTLFHDSESEKEMEALDEVDVPYCATKDKEAIHDDEAIMHAENTEAINAPAQEETVSYPPPLVFDNALPYDEKEEDESSNVLNPACYSDTLDNIDEFIHVGGRRWDIVGYDLDPIYDTENHFQLFPLQLSQPIASDQW